MSSWTPLIALHAVAAATSLLLGGYQLLRGVKGDAVHRRVGWLWVAAMTFVATSSFAIREIRHGQLSLLHLLSVVTLVSLIIGIVQTRRGNLAGHRAAMRGSYYGLLGAAIGAAAPGRRIPTLAVTNAVGALAGAAGIILLTVAVLTLARAVDRWRPAPTAPPTAASRRAGAAPTALAARAVSRDPAE